MIKMYADVPKSFYRLKISANWTLLSILTLNILLSCVQGHMVHLGLTKRFAPHLNGQLNNLHGLPGEGYYLEVAIGTPPQKLNVLIDTGSSNFAVAAEEDVNITSYFHRSQSLTYRNKGVPVFVPYTQGRWDGLLGTDYVTMTSLPNVSVEASIAFITSSENFFINGSNWQGILGFGYAEIARPDKSVEPYFDTLIKDGRVSNIFSVQLCGDTHRENGTDILAGSLLLGGVDESLYAGKMFYTPIHKEWYYEVIIVDIEVNGDSLNMDCKEYNFDKTIIDSGTTNLRLPLKVFDKTLAMIKAQVQRTTTYPGSSFWSGDDVLCWREGMVPFGDFPTITIALALQINSSFKLILSPQQYLRAVGDEADVHAGEDCFKFAIASSESGSVIGAIVMEGYYVIFDRAQKKIGFAQSTCNIRDPKAIRSTVVGPFPYTGSSIDCAYAKPSTDDKTLTYVAYVMAGICVVCVLPLIILVVNWQCRRSSCWNRPRRNSDTSDLMTGR